MVWRHSIWDEMKRMQDEMDRLFESFFSYNPVRGERALLTGPSDRSLVSSSYREPLADVWETDNEIVANIEIPGVDKQDIKINATNDGIEIKVEKKEEKKEEKKGMYRIERNYTGFYRYIGLPDIDPNKIQASYKNGILELKMPKSESHKKHREIKVE